MTEDQIFRERIKNWARVMGDVNRAGVKSFLGQYTEQWREDCYKAQPRCGGCDTSDAAVIERAVLKLDLVDRNLIRDWYLFDFSIGKIARRNGLFFSAVYRCVVEAEIHLKELVAKNEATGC